MNKSYAFMIALIVLSASLGAFLYKQMPEKMASHWNAKGEVDGYMPKFWGLLLLPIILTGCFLLFVFIPTIDPLKKNIAKFRRFYDGFILAFVLFMFYIYALTIAYNFIEFNMTYMILPALGILFYYIGIMLKHTKRNWFIGIRTPWTLSSDVVWDKTQVISGKLFRIAGIIAFIGIFFGEASIWFVLVPIIFVSLYSIVYSYYIFQKEKRKK
ncbi:SdpI family protein [Candidatus Woesearchaeota archaeon]|nr:SdpI family protein [Candidatus Woesearchaeota archaeon]